MSASHDLSRIGSIARLLALLLAIAVPAAADSVSDSGGDVVRDPTLPQDMKALDFEIGRALFDREWAPAPASTEAADGLGPLFNARSCNACHPGGGRGVPFDKSGAVLAALLFRLGGHSADYTDPIYGRQIQTGGVAGLAAEARALVSFEKSTVTLKDGTAVTLRKPVPRLAQLGEGRLASATVISPRLATAIDGIGLLQRIPEDEILGRADPTDEDADGVSGRPNRVIDRVTGTTAIGRFGWKAGEAELQAQDAKALNLDIGLSNPVFPDAYGDCTKPETRCHAMPNGASPQFDNLEVPASLTRLIDRFVAEAVLPASTTPTPADVAQGRDVFMEVGCEACHRASFDLPAAEGLPARTIAPYSDLLLHDMGPGLADHMVEGEASGREWRTAPLWGIGAASQKDGVGLLHDGRARSILEAILWHDGEAKKARQRVEALSREDRQALIDFVGSL
ncbi:MAG TPA: di-heme oxidoredictase family protein [Candidatus Cybelea sp.]|nr:di-heme oxidoredictase family protein [Candidatus Cybelea sp.]